MTRIDAEDIALLELRLENTALLAEVEQLKATVRGWEIDNGAPLTEAELAARPKPTHRLVTPPDAYGSDGSVRPYIG